MGSTQNPRHTEKMCQVVMAVKSSVCLALKSNHRGRKRRGTWDKAGARSRGPIMQSLVNVRHLNLGLRAMGSHRRDVSNRVTRSDLLSKEVILASA